MPVVDLQIAEKPSVSGYSNQFVVGLAFEHENDDITEVETVVFPSETEKADIVEMINTLWAADEHFGGFGRTPTDNEVKNYEKWCSCYGGPGLQAWPSDHNGVYFAALRSVVVEYCDEHGTRFEVSLVEE